MGSLFLSSRQVNLLSCGCLSIRTNRRFFAAIRCLICPVADHFRISVKSELNGIGSSFLCNRAREGDLLDVSAPRGSFTLRPSQSPVVLLSAGVGATPVMSMLHALAAERSQREIWWIYGARNRVDHPFAEESRSLLKQLSRGRGYVVYSRPAATDKVGADFDAPGHIDTDLLERIGVSQGSDFYLCGPIFVLAEYARWTAKLGCARRECAHGNLRCSRELLLLVWRRSITLLTCRKGRPDLAPQSHSRAAGLPPHGIVSLRVCSNWRRRATFRSDGRAGLEFVIPA